MSRLVTAELLKLRTTRLWWGLLLGILLTSALLGTLTGAIAGLDQDGDGTGATSVTDPALIRSTYTAGLGFAYLFTLSLGIIVMAGEYRHRTMSATVLSVPVRIKIVLAKAFALFGAGAGYGVAMVLASTAAGAVVFSIRGLDLWRDGGKIPQAMLLAVLATALWALIGLGVGTLIRNQIVALLVAIGIGWIVEPLIGFALQQLDVGDVAKFLPTAATNAVVEPARQEGVDLTLLPWWGGALVLLAYALGSAAIGAALTLRRDIT
jgi:ABC-type transport system involved in multi-copper enzyme maturation permease subunit